MRNINGMKELVFKKFFSLIQSVMSEVAKFFMRMSLNYMKMMLEICRIVQGVEIEC